MTTIDRDRIHSLLSREQARFEEEHPISRKLFERAHSSLLAGVPMNWMTRWVGGFPVFVDEAQGSHFTDVDGHTYIDFCLGDTGAMAGHSPRPSVAGITERAGRGITLMLPSEDSIWVGEEMARRFGLPYWQFALTATDANRFVLRLARDVTQRPKILVFNWCYHGTVDESFATLEGGRVVARAGNVGPPVDVSATTRVCEFNDVEALEAELAHEDVACVLAEPALTNIGIIHPEPGFHDHLRRLTRRYGTLLVIDETHTICSGPGGFTKAEGLEPDVVTIGKPLAAGLPAAAYGLSEEVGQRILERADLLDPDAGGIGGTLAGNALSLAAMRATLENVLTEQAFEHMISLAERFVEGVSRVIESHGLEWHITRLGCRAEYLFTKERPLNGSAAAAARDEDLEELMHLYSLNRGILLTPFHMMALMSPQTTAADVDVHSEVFESAAEELTG
ncbi:MAG TPA: aspartate aminotransferase family protein [Actinomycetota bacterium]|nr:aspartate aminotransferase family protein [Actinomycetota bacterium]